MRLRSRTATVASAVAVLALAGGCSVITEVRGRTTTTVPPTTTIATSTTVATTTTVAPTTTTEAPPPYVLPVAGECREVTGVDVVGPSVDERDPIDCQQPHGAETVLVLRDALVALGEYPADRFALPPGLHASLATTCQAAFDAHLGLPPLGSAGRVASRLTPAWFLPPQVSWDLGARYVRCDVVVEPVPGQGGRYAGPFRGVLAGAQVPVALAACFDADLRRARCDAGHASEAVADAVFPGATERPGDEAVAAARVEQCEPAAASAIGVGSMAEQPRLATALLLPSADAWELGVRTGTCYVLSAEGLALNDSVRGIGSAPPPLVTLLTATTAPAP